MDKDEEREVESCSCRNERREDPSDTDSDDCKDDDNAILRRESSDEASDARSF
jgi:hypothetical protein